jgi:hypothetical protein
MIGCPERWLLDQCRSKRFPGRKLNRGTWRFTDTDIQGILDICLMQPNGKPPFDPDDPTGRAAELRAMGLPVPTRRSRRAHGMNW